MNNTHRRHRGRRDQAARARLAPVVAAGVAECWRCGEPIRPDDEWDAGHVVSLGEGGEPSGAVAPEHSRCNRRAGSLLGHQLRRSRRTRLREWLADFFGGPTSWTPAPVRFSPPTTKGIRPGTAGSSTHIWVAAEGIA